MSRKTKRKLSRDVKKTVSVSTRAGTKLLYGKELSAYEDVDIEELLLQLTPEQLEQLCLEVDPDDYLLPANERCKNQTNKLPTGPLNRKKLLDFLEKCAREEKDWPEMKPFESGIVRGKVWTPKTVVRPLEEFISLDWDDDYDHALGEAAEEDLVDLAAILGLHSMMNQEQFYASFGRKRTLLGKFESIVKVTQPKFLPPLPDNDTDVENTIQQVQKNDHSLTSLNWNNIKRVSVDKFLRLFSGLKANSWLVQLTLANTHMTDTAARALCQALEENKCLKVINVESNYISPPLVRDLLRSLLITETVQEFRASNQKPQILGVKTEMDIAKLVEDNKTLVNLGLHLNVADARIRVDRHLQHNRDKFRLERISSSLS